MFRGKPLRVMLYLLLTGHIQPASKHRGFLRWIPLHNITSSLFHQRKLILHGARARETPEDVCEREMRREIRAVLPLVFGGVLSAIANGIVACAYVGD